MFRSLLLASLGLVLSGCSPMLTPPAQAAGRKTVKARPAPVLRFDGEEYFLVEQSSAGGAHRLAFLRDGDSPEKCNRRLWIRQVPCTDLRAYELKYTANWDQAQRDVTYRSPSRLVHSGWTQPGALLEYHLMHWEQQGRFLLSCEFELLSRPPSADAAAMRQLVRVQDKHWSRELKGLFKQAPRLLQDSFPKD